MNEDLRKWFSQKWVRMDTKGNIKGDCAREPGEGKPKCLPLAKAMSMDKQDRAAAVRRKRREDPNPERQGEPINVRTEACWDGYVARGMKKKGNKMVPNCVPEEIRRIVEIARVARKKGQPANSNKHSDLYTDENPSGTISGLKFASADDAADSVKKIKSSGRSHAHKIQAAVAMEQRARVIGKTSAAAVYRSFINDMKEKTKEMKEEKGSYDWNNPEPAKYAKHLESFFGKPDELTDNRAVWYDVDGFKRIEVLDEHIMHSSPAPHYDYVYCYIDLKVTHDLAGKLAESSESILIDFLKNEVGARCASLAANAVTLNYVMDVVENRVKPSKQVYEKRILDMKSMFEKGKTFELDWWPDTTKDTDPQNPYYKIHESCNHSSSLLDRIQKILTPIAEEDSTSELIKKSQSKRGSPGTLKAKIQGPLTLAKVRSLKSRPGATTLDKKQANFYINMHSEEYLEEKNVPTNPGLWARAKALARSKFDVYPSAYANGWAAKWYKGKGGSWKSVQEGKQMKSLKDIFEGVVVSADFKLDKRGRKYRAKRKVMNPVKDDAQESSVLSSIQNFVGRPYDLKEISANLAKSYIVKSKAAGAKDLNQVAQRFAGSMRAQGAIHRDELKKMSGRLSQQRVQLGLQGVAEGSDDNDTAKAAYMHGLKHGREGVGNNMDRAQAEWGNDFKHYNAGFLKGRNKKAQSLKAVGQGYGNKEQGVAEAKDPREYDYEGDMAKSQLRSIIANSQSVHDMLKDTTNMAEWVQSKITKAEDYMSTVADYMTAEMNEAKQDDDEDYTKHHKLDPDSGVEADQHIHVQLKKAVDSTIKPYEITFKNGKKHTVSSPVAKTIVNAIEKLKPDNRKEVHDEIHKSYDSLIGVHKAIVGK